MTNHKSFLYLLSELEKTITIDKQAFISSFNLPISTSIKLNKNKKQNVNYLFDLSEKVLWCEDAYYLNERPEFFSDPLLYAGAYYVMDASSMFLEYILACLKIPKDAFILDIAAAPGGKSVIINNYLNTEGLLWSNEYQYGRAKILDFNLAKWGNCNHLVSSASTEKFSALNELFDVVVCDAPCSGSGLFRKYPDWINSFNSSLVYQCSIRQKEILKNIFSSIKENGYLIYSTCSYMPQENEEIAAFIIQNGFEEVKINTPETWNVFASQYGYRFFQHLTKAEGFYYAIFQKKQSTAITNTTSSKSIDWTIIQHDVSELMNIPNNHALIKYKEKVFLVNQAVCNIKTTLYKQFNFLSLGACLYNAKKNTPEPEMALSLYLSDNIKKIELTLQDAQKYLQKQNIHLSAPKDIYLMTYQNLGLGWAKILDNRVNNYYPNEWRILSDIKPN